jgi:hypothetical protein
VSKERHCHGNLCIGTAKSGEMFEIGTYLKLVQVLVDELAKLERVDETVKLERGLWSLRVNHFAGEPSTTAQLSSLPTSSICRPNV